MQHREKISENGSAKSSDTRTDLSNQIFIMSDSIVKDVRDYELSYEVEKCIVYVKSSSLVDYKGYLAHLPASASKFFPKTI